MLNFIPVVLLHTFLKNPTVVLNQENLELKMYAAGNKQPCPGCNAHGGYAWLICMYVSYETNHECRGALQIWDQNEPSIARIFARS